MKPLSHKALAKLIDASAIFGKIHLNNDSFVNGCITVYRDRPFFLSVATIDEQQANASLDEQIHFLPATNSMAICYSEIEEVADLAQKIEQNGSLTTLLNGIQAIYINPYEELISGESYYFSVAKTEVSTETPLLTLNYTESSNGFERFIQVKNTPVTNHQSITGCPLISSTGELKALLAYTSIEEDCVYGFSLGELLEHLDRYIDEHPDGYTIPDPRKKKSGKPPRLSSEMLFDLEESDSLYSRSTETFISNVELISQDKEYIDYPVYYGTNRNPYIEDGKQKFGNERKQELYFGICGISIPASHETGELERPNWFQRLIYGESPERYFTLLSNEKTDKSAFEHALSERLRNSEKDDILLFIHGFNVEFEEAMMRSAQLGHDLSFKGAVTAFSWPSMGKVSGYITDLDSSRLAADYLCDFIQTLLSNNPGNLHIIAHSMGNVALSYALLELKNRGAFPNPTIHQIILAAPDIDQEIFVRQIMPSIKGASRLTLYASEKDKAIIASRTIRNNYRRLGDGGDKMAVLDGLESVDASKVDTSMLGHGYFADTQALLNDIHMVLQGTAPNDRILDSKIKLVEGINLPYWLFRNS